jgi:hypothetical protein
MRHRSTAALLAAPALLLALPAGAADFFYAGGALSRAKIESNRTLGAGSFSDSDFGWKLYGGYRALDWLAAELSYVSFGTPTDTVGGVRYDARASGLAAHGIALLPVGDFDVYGKAGLARLDHRLTSPTVRIDRTDTRFTYGVGTQWNSGNLHVRAEYESYDTPGGTPRMLSLGVGFSFR